MPANGPSNFGIGDALKIYPKRIFQRVIPGIGHRPFEGLILIDANIIRSITNLIGFFEHIFDRFAKLSQLFFSGFFIIAKSWIADIIF